MLFDHCARRGVALHVILSETENESLFEHRDGPGDAFEQTGVPFADTRKLYYRELIARFAHHPALVWNLGEENGPEGEGKKNSDATGNTNAQRLAFAQFIKETDPYDHPIVVHTYPGKQEAVYTPLLGSPYVDGVSLQLKPMEVTREQTLKWIKLSREAGRPWFACLDEVGEAKNGVLPDDADGAADNHRRVRRALWANLLSGGSGGGVVLRVSIPPQRFKFRRLPQPGERLAVLQNRPRVRRSRGPAPVRPGHADRGDRRGRRRRRLRRDPPRSRRPPRGDAAVRPPPGRPPLVPLPPGEHAVRWFDPDAGGDWTAAGAASVRGNGGTTGPGAPPRQRPVERLGRQNRRLKGAGARPRRC